MLEDAKEKGESTRRRRECVRERRERNVLVASCTSRPRVRSGQNRSGWNRSRQEERFLDEGFRKTTAAALEIAAVGRHGGVVHEGGRGRERGKVGR